MRTCRADKAKRVRLFFLRIVTKEKSSGVRRFLLKAEPQGEISAFQQSAKISPWGSGFNIVFNKK